MSTDGDPVSGTDLLGVARVGLAERGELEAMLWEDIDLDDSDDRVFGDYELIERIGHGGMGVVFRARQISLGRDVAIKFIVRTLAADAKAVERFRREALAAARLYHPNIVPVYEAGAVEGLHFFSMPLLRGQTLAERIASAPMQRTDAVALTLKLGAAVAYAHSLGLLHLDLKPANVLFDERDQPMIGDFGLARHMDAGGGVDAQDFSGTPAYAAPEQVNPDIHRLTPCADIYALGAILYELLTGDPPHGRGDAKQQAQRAITGSIAAPRAKDRAISRDLDAISMKCLAPDPCVRYQSAAELNVDLANYLAGEEITARAPTLAEKMLRGLRLHPTLALAGATAIMALALGLATTTWQWRRAEKARVEVASQAERTQQLAGLMAAAFPTDAPHSHSAHDAVAWLKEHTAGEPAAQRDLLTEFNRALTAANKGDAVAALVNEIIDQLGADYREQQVRRLLARGDRDSLLAAALVGMPRSNDKESSPSHEAVLRTLFANYADDQIALYVVALACNAQPFACPHPEYQRRLTEDFPQNAVHFLLLPSGAKPSDAELAVLIQHAAQAQYFDDELGTLMRLMRLAFDGEAVPDSIRLPMEAVVGERDVAPSLRNDAFSDIFLPSYGPFVKLCNPSNDEVDKISGLRAACGAFAIKAMHSQHASILARMVASAMIRRLYKGTQLEAEAREYRRQYVWLDQHRARDPGGAEELENDVIRFGEWEAWQRHAERAGIPRFPPAAWLPANPQLLLLSEERTQAAPTL